MNSHQEYIEKREWYCEKSPTHAHWWVEHIPTQASTPKGIFVCKWCGDAKRMPTSTMVAVEATIKMSRGKSLDEALDGNPHKMDSGWE